jgi:FAD/FMN-containing dehydrogenase
VQRRGGAVTLQFQRLDGGETEIGDADFERLRTAFRGRLIARCEADYDDARRVWNGTIDRRPALIAQCSGTADVIAAINFASRHGLLVAVRGGGHSIPGHSVCDDGLVIDLSRVRGVDVDPRRRTVRAQGGAQWGDLDHESQAFGLATPLLSPGKRFYVPFAVPKEGFTYPREEMSTELLSLGNLKNPIKIDYPRLDEINKALFEVGSKTNRIVQILTNKPQTAFYVACVSWKPKDPDMREFYSVLRYAGRTPARDGNSYLDLFFDRANDEAGKEHLQALLEQIRQQTDSKILIDAAEIKTFNDQTDGA